WIDGDELRNRSDVLFYFTGAAWVSGLDTLRFRPGAIADHLTSAGGMLTSDYQMGALRWLEAGGTRGPGGGGRRRHLPREFPAPRGGDRALPPRRDTRRGLLEERGLARPGRIRRRAARRAVAPALALTRRHVSGRGGGSRRGVTARMVGTSAAGRSRLSR